MLGVSGRFQESNGKEAYDIHIFTYCYVNAPAEQQSERAQWRKLFGAGAHGAGLLKRKGSGRGKGNLVLSHYRIAVRRLSVQTHVPDCLHYRYVNSHKDLR